VKVGAVAGAEAGAVAVAGSVAGAVANLEIKTRARAGIPHEPIHPIYGIYLK